MQVANQSSWHGGNKRVHRVGFLHPPIGKTDVPYPDATTWPSMARPIIRLKCAPIRGFTLLKLLVALLLLSLSFILLTSGLQFGTRAWNDGGGGSDNRLEMPWRLFREAQTSSGPQGEERRVALLDKVTQIQFAYFGRPQPQGAARWYNDWQDLDSLPNLIRMRVTLSGGAQVWPDLTVATNVQTVNIIINPEE